MVRKKKEFSRREVLLSELASECESPEEFMDLLSDVKEDHPRRVWPDGNRNASRSQRLVRAQADRQASTPFSRIRSESHCALCQRNDNS